MSTNDRKIIRTEHVPTGKPVDFYLSRDVSPSVQNKIQRWEKLQENVERLQEQNADHKPTDDEKEELAGLYLKINDLGLQIFASILDPADGIPSDLAEQFGYDNKFDYISDCAKSNYVIARTINFFYSFLPSSTASLEDKDYRERLEGQVQVVETSTDSSR